MSSTGFLSSRPIDVRGSGITTLDDEQSPGLGSRDLDFWSSQPCHPVSAWPRPHHLTSLGLMSPVVRCRDCTEVTNWWLTDVFGLAQEIF